ncbi:MAG: tetratricopeptide repeat protein [Myxococcota bacterium]
MYDPYFESTIAEIRGLDLGDGAQLLAHLNAGLGEGLSGEEHLLRGVLLLRRGKDDDALECMDLAIDKGHGTSRTHYVRSCMLREAGRLGEALEALEEARDQAEHDKMLSPADLDHAKALLFWRVGSRDDALAQLDRTLEKDSGSAARWLHRGQLLVELGRFGDAEASFDRALVEEQDLDLAMYERAALEAARNDSAAVALWLGKALRLQPEHRNRAISDPRFAKVREADELIGVLSEPLPPDLRWLDDLSTWMPALRRSPELARLGVRWLGEADAKQISEALDAEYQQGPLGTMHTEPTLARSRELLKTRRAVARGPSSKTREGTDEPSLVFIDVERPHEGLWLALSESYPPFLWIQVDPRPSALELVLAEYFPRPRRTRADLPAMARGFLGYREQFVVPSPYTGGLEPATVIGIDRHFTINPFVESASWGSAYDGDPWPDEIPEQPELTHKLAIRQREVAQQAPGHIWSLTRRTRHSRSYLSIEVHHHDLFVAEARYRPSRHSLVIEAMNDYFGCDYPTDMPVDVVAALLGFQFDGARDLESELEDTEDPEQVAGLLLVISALRHADLGALPLYRSFLAHPDSMVRGTVGDIAMAYNYESLLEEMCLSEPDAAIRADIESVLDDGIPMSDDDPYDDVVEEVSGLIELGDEDIEDESYLLADSDLEPSDSSVDMRRPT